LSDSPGRGLTGHCVFDRSGHFAGAESALKVFDAALIDKSVDPCENFYRFSCNGWFKRNPLPADQASYGRFTELSELNRLHLRQILEEESPSSATRSKEIPPQRERAEDRRRVCELHGHGGGEQAGNCAA